MKSSTVRRLSWKRFVGVLGCLGLTAFACTSAYVRPRVLTAAKRNSEPKEKRKLQVVFAGPQKLATPAAQVSVVMNQPMRALEEVEMKAPSFVTMTPQVPGRWRWIGTQAILFEPEGGLPLATHFRVAVPAGTTPLHGLPLEEPYVFEFETVRPALTGVHPYRELGDLELDTVFQLTFNQPITPEDLKRAVRLSARPINKAEAPETPLDVVVDPIDEKEPTVLRVHAKDRLPKASEIKLVVMPELRGKLGPLTSDKREERSFRTYGALEVRGFRCEEREREGEDTGCQPDPADINLTFSTPVDAKELAAHIRIEPSTPFEVGRNGAYGDNASFVELFANWKPSTTYRVHIRKGLTDKHGEVLSRDWEGSLRIGPLESEVGFNFTGEYFIPSNKPSDKPLSIISRNHKKLNIAYVPLDERGFFQMRDTFQRFLEVDDAMPHWREEESSIVRVFSGLPDARTQVKARAVPDLVQTYAIPANTLLQLQTNKRAFVVAVEDDARRYASFGMKVVQFTDISMQAKLSHVGSLFRFTRASTGAAIANAEISLYEPNTKATTIADGEELKLYEPPVVDIPRSAMHFISDSDGFVHVPAATFDPIRPKRSYDVGTVVVKTPSDWAFFSLSGDWTDVLEERLNARGMLFGERKLYRPGETAHLKGILREPARMGTAPQERIPKNKMVQIQLKNALEQILLEKKIETTRFGTFALDYAIPDTALVGDVTASVSLAGQELNVDDPIFEVAEYRPNETTVHATPERSSYTYGETPSFRIHAESYSGVPLAGKTVHAVYWRELAEFRPPNLTEDFLTNDSAYRIRDRKRRISTREHQQLPMDTLGNTTLNAGLDPYMPAGAERLVMSAEVADAGGQPAAINTSVLVHPASFYLAVAAPKNLVEWNLKKFPRVLAVDPTGNPISNVAVHVELIRRSRVGVDPADDQVLASCDLKTRTEPETCALSADKVGRFLVRATAVDDQGRKVAASQLVAYLPQTELKVTIDAAISRPIALTSDKKIYRIGDTARLTAQSPFEKADAFITVEGDGIYQQRVVELTGPSSTLDIPVTGDMWPSAEVSVLLTERGKTNTNTPVAYRAGRLALNVSLDDRTLALTLKAPNELKPGAAVPVEIGVHDAMGRPTAAEVTMYAVDERVLSLTNEKNPDPLRFFAQRRFSLVASMDSRNFIGTFHNPEFAIDPLAEWRHAMRNFDEDPIWVWGTRMSASIDHDDLGSLLSPTRRDFRTTAYYNPSIITDAQGKAKVSFTLPDSFSKYRLVAIAVDEKDNMGGAETTIRTVHDLMLRPIAPRFFRVGDTAHVGAVVSSLLPGRNEFELELRPEGLDGKGERKQRVILEQNQSKEVRFEVQANRVGKAKLHLLGRSGKTTDSVVVEREVRLPVPPETVALYGDTHGEQIEEIAPFPNLRTDIGGMDIELSNSALVGLADTMSELLDVRHGTTEELVSRLVAILASRDVSKAVGVTPPAGMDQLARETIDKLQAAQIQGEGSWSDFAGSPEGDKFVSAYALLGLALAKQKGLTVPDATIDKGVQYLSTYLMKQFGQTHGDIHDHHLDGDDGDDDSAPKNSARTEDKPKLDKGIGFVVDALVEAEIAKPHTIPTTRLRELIHTAIQRRTEINVASRAILLHAALRYGSNVDPADGQVFPAMRAELESFIRLTGPLGLVVEPESNAYNPQLDSSTRTTALVLRALLALNPDHPLAARLSRGLLSTRNGRGWGTTQEKAWALLALGDYKRAQEHTNTNFSAVVSLSGDELGKVTFPSGRNSAFHFKAPITAMSEPNTLDFQVDGQGTVFYSAKLRYAFEEQPTEPLEEGLSIRRIQRAVNFQNIEEAMDAPPGADGATFQEGALILTDLLLVVPTPRNNVVVEDPLPAGLEPVNTGFATTSQWIAEALIGDEHRKKQRAMTQRMMARQMGQPVPVSAYRNDWYRQELRDDRALFFVQHAKPGLYRFQYLTRAITPGTFQRPPVRAEDIYAPDVYGRSGGSVVRIMAAGK